MTIRQWIQSQTFQIRQRLRDLNRARLQNRRQARKQSYAAWLARTEPLRNASPTNTDAEHVTVIIRHAKSVSSTMLDMTLDALKAQSHKNWSVVVVPDDTCPNELTQVIGTSATALDQWHEGAKWVLELETGDQLAEHAMAWMLAALSAASNSDAIYADHDHIAADGSRCEPMFKPEWDPDFHLSTGYAAHGCMLNRSLAPGASPSQWNTDEILLQHCVGETTPRVKRLPAILMHRPLSCLGTSTPGRLARVQNLLDAHHAPNARAVALPGRIGIRVQWPAPLVWPKVSVIIPTRDQLRLLRTCVDSVLQRTDYPDLEIIIVDNGSCEEATQQYLKALQSTANIHVLHDDAPFNYSRLNNLAAAKAASGSVLALLNNDIEVIEPAWLKEMVRHALRPEIGCVGAKLLYSNRTIQHGGVILGISKEWRSQIGVASHAFKGMHPDEPGYMGRAQVCQRFSAVTAACLVVRKSVYDAVNGLDEERLAVAYNDVDFCLRVKEAGWHNLWTPYATLIHHESISRGRDLSAEKQTRLGVEATYMRDRWGALLMNDPAYNPNLSLDHADFSPSFPSRSPYSRQ